LVFEVRPCPFYRAQSRTSVPSTAPNSQTVNAAGRGWIKRIHFDIRMAMTNLTAMMLSFAVMAYGTLGAVVSDFRMGVQYCYSTSRCSGSDDGGVKYTPYLSSGGGWSDWSGSGKFWKTFRVGMFTKNGEYANSVAIQDKDFRFAIEVDQNDDRKYQYSGATKYTKWASEGGGWSGWADAGSMDIRWIRVRLEVRDSPDLMITNLKIGAWASNAQHSAGDGDGSQRTTNWLKGTTGGWTALTSGTWSSTGLEYAAIFMDRDFSVQPCRQIILSGFNSWSHDGTYKANGQTKDSYSVYELQNYREPNIVYRQTYNGEAGWAIGHLNNLDSDPDDWYKWKRGIDLYDGGDWYYRLYGGSQLYHHPSYSGKVVCSVTNAAADSLTAPNEEGDDEESFGDFIPMIIGAAAGFAFVAGIIALVILRRKKTTAKGVDIEACDAVHVPDASVITVDAPNEETMAEETMAEETMETEMSSDVVVAGV